MSLEELYKGKKGSQSVSHIITTFEACQGYSRDERKWKDHTSRHAEQVSFETSLSTSVKECKLFHVLIHYSQTLQSRNIQLSRTTLANKAAESAAPCE